MVGSGGLRGVAEPPRVRTCENWLAPVRALRGDHGQSMFFLCKIKEFYQIVLSFLSAQITI